MQFPKLALFAVSLTAFAADSGIWKIAPPPPASWQRDRVKDLAARRKALMDQIGDKAVLILYAAEPRNYSNDVDWPFRQENDFFYLTGLTQPGATLVLSPGAGKLREMVFIPRSNPAQETWTGHMITQPEARETSGIQDVFEAGQLNGFLTALMPRARPVLAEPMRPRAVDAAVAEAAAAAMRQRPPPPTGPRSSPSRSSPRQNRNSRFT